MITFVLLQMKRFLCFAFPRGLLLQFSFVCICEGLKEVSSLSELLNFEDFLVKSGNCAASF